MKRIYSIDFFKLLFAYFIALGHFGANVTPNGGVTVQLFFVISGFFLGKKFYEKNKDKRIIEYNQWDYTIDHVKSLYSHYIFSLVIMVLYSLMIHFVKFIRTMDISQLSAIFKEMYSLIPEILLLQNVGFFGGGINYPLWQVCTLVVASYFIYGLLCINEKLSREMIFPAAVLMIQAFLSTGVDSWGTVVFFHTPILRAFSALCIGVLVYYFITTHYYKTITEKKWLFNIASLVAFLTLFIYNDYHNIHLITFVVLFLAMYDINSWINKILNLKIFKDFGKLSYAIYLNHALVINILNLHIYPRVNQLIDGKLTNCCRIIVFLILLTIYSIATLCIVGKIEDLKKN